VSESSGTGPQRRGRGGETVAGSVKFGPLEHWIGFNLRMAQEATLTIIARNPGISQTELSHANGRDKSSLTPVVEDLVRRGLVERTRMDNDRRTYRLTLTAQGKKILTQLTRCARRHERNLDRVIGMRDRKRFLALLKKIAAEIE
jgi:DNA-binding MarR family transcriptional regulator